MHDLLPARLQSALDKLAAIARDGIVEASLPSLAVTLGVAHKRSAQRLVAELLDAGALVRDRSGGGRSHLSALRLTERVTERTTGKGDKGRPERVTKGDSTVTLSSRAPGVSSLSSASLRSLQSDETKAEASERSEETARDERVTERTTGKGDRRVVLCLEASPELLVLLQALGRALPQGIVDRDLKPGNVLRPTAAEIGDAVWGTNPANIGASHPANTAAPIQALPARGTTDRNTLDRFAALAKRFSKSDQEVEADQLRLLRHPSDDHVRAAIASVELKIARGKPVQSLGLVFALMRSGGPFEEGAVASWPEVDKLIAAARNPAPPIARATSEPTSVGTVMRASFGKPAKTDHYVPPAPDRRGPSAEQIAQWDAEYDARMREEGRG